MKYLGKSFSSPANSKEFVDGWERTFGDEEPAQDGDAVEITMRVHGVPRYSYCAACEQDWPLWSDAWTDGSPSHKDPTSEHVVPCVKTRLD
jgi:hypothetical protein